MACDKDYLYIYDLANGSIVVFDSLGGFSQRINLPSIGRGSYFGDDFIVKDGKITDMWQNYDELGFLKQLGAIPAP